MTSPKMDRFVVARGEGDHLQTTINWRRLELTVLAIELGAHHLQVVRYVLHTTVFDF